MEKEIGWLLKEKYNNKPCEKFYKDIERLKVGEPVDYVIGFTDFLGCKIDLLKKPLIPRPETEFWVGQVISRFMIQDSGFKILDIFCGSGCIGLAVLKHIKGAKVTFADRYKYVTGVNFIESDVFRNVRGKFDYIFANPPYIPTVRKNEVGKSVLKYEPKTALFGGADGLFYINKFLRDARAHLNKNGKIFMEFSPEQKKEIEKLLKKYNYSKCQFYKDQFDRWRWVEIGC